MKVKSFVFISLLLVQSPALFTQVLTDVARCKELTWYGIDFTQARFIGFSREELKSYNLKDCSYSNLSEDDKSLIRKSYGKKSLKVETLLSQFRNDSTNCIDLASDKVYNLNFEKIVKIVDEYKIEGLGYGVLGVVESVEKVTNSIFIWIVYLDNSTGKIISSKRYTGCGWAMNNRLGDFYSIKGIKLIIKLSGKDLQRYSK